MGEAEENGWCLEGLQAAGGQVRNNCLMAQQIYINGGGEGTGSWVWGTDLATGGWSLAWGTDMVTMAWSWVWGTDIVPGGWSSVTGIWYRRGTSNVVMRQWCMLGRLQWFLLDFAAFGSAYLQFQMAFHSLPRYSDVGLRCRWHIPVQKLLEWVVELCNSNDMWKFLAGSPLQAVWITNVLGLLPFSHTVWGVKLRYVITTWVCWSVPGAVVIRFSSHSRAAALFQILGRVTSGMVWIPLYSELILRHSTCLEFAAWLPCLSTGVQVITYTGSALIIWPLCRLQYHRRSMAPDEMEQRQ